MSFARRLSLSAVLACVVALASCAPAPPQELEGLWAQGEGGCAAQTGLRFERQAVRWVSGDRSETVLSDPRYAVAPDGENLRITIRYALAPGLFGPRQAAELELIRRRDGWLAVAAHRTADGRRGYARLRTEEADPLYALMRTRRCGAGAWIEDLRGRPEQEIAARRESGGEGAGTESGRVEAPPQAVSDQLRGRAAELQDSSWLAVNAASPGA